MGDDDEDCGGIDDDEDEVEDEGVLVDVDGRAEVAVDVDDAEPVRVCGGI